jgi:hypothetical protein
MPDTILDFMKHFDKSPVLLSQLMYPLPFHFKYRAMNMKAVLRRIIRSDNYISPMTSIKVLSMSKFFSALGGCCYLADELTRYESWSFEVECIWNLLPRCKLSPHPQPPLGFHNTTSTRSSSTNWFRASISVLSILPPFLSAPQEPDLSK